MQLDQILKVTKYYNFSDLKLFDYKVDFKYGTEATTRCNWKHDKKGISWFTVGVSKYFEAFLKTIDS